MQTEHKTALHLGIAENGKLYCLRGDYSEALRHFREAIRLSQQHGEMDIFFQHYSQCVLETLELSGAHTEVIECSEGFLEFLADKTDESGFLNKMRASILERIGVQYLMLDEKAAAVPVLKEALALGGKKGNPLSHELLNWAQRGFAVSKKQIQDLQKRFNYFIVRKDKVNPAIAVELPKAFSPF